MNLGGGGGGGRQTSTSETRAEFPPEFRPLVESAVPQIQAVQSALPLAAFAQAQPAQVAGLSPMLLEALRLALSTQFTTPQERALSDLSLPIRGLATGLLDVTTPTRAAQASLRTLGGRLDGENIDVFPTPFRDLLATLVLGAMEPTSPSAFPMGPALTRAPLQAPALAFPSPSPTVADVPLVAAPVLGPTGASPFVLPAQAPAPVSMLPTEVRRTLPFVGTPLPAPVLVPGVGTAFTVEELEVLKEQEALRFGSA